MSEPITEMVIPGVYIEVRDEGLIRPGPISVGNIGVVGTAEIGKENVVVHLSDYTQAKESFGLPDPNDKYTLSRAIGLIYNNGARSVFAVKVKEGEYVAGLEALENEDVHIIVVAGEAVSAEKPEVGIALMNHCNKTLVEMRERIAVVGCDEKEVGKIKEVMKGIDSDRLIVVAPGIEVYKPDEKKIVPLSSGYTAAAVAGKLSSLAVHVSLTNKVLSVGGLQKEYTYSELKELLNNRVCILQKKNGVRIVRGITSSTNTVWEQITTRRIVDYAKFGLRASCRPYIGKLNNPRVRSALKSALDSFLFNMMRDEALVGYQLNVSAIRDDEVEGRCLVDTLLQPTFCIDYIRIAMYLE